LTVTSAIERAYSSSSRLPGWRFLVRISFDPRVKAAAAVVKLVNRQGATEGAGPKCPKGNGLYGYSSSSAFSTNSYNATNYCVDVLFIPSPDRCWFVNERKARPVRRVGTWVAIVDEFGPARS
jgi:hypothetical protein